MERSAILKLIILAMMVFGITVVHYYIVDEYHVIQDVCRKLYYIPIVLSSFWYGFKGGIILALATSVFYAPFVISHWGAPFYHDADRVSEIVLYNVIGWITGFMAQRQTTIQQRYKRTFEKLKESYKQLKEQTDLRIEAEERLREADRLATLGEMAASMAHEIGNPLGSIKGAAEILCDDYTEDSDKYEFAQILLKETQRLDSAIRDFLQLGKARLLELTEVDLNQLIRTTTHFIAPQCASKAISVELSLDDKLSNIPLDARQLEQALLNLLFNAIAAMPDGGRLTLSTEKTKRDDINFAIIEIEDTGEGIPESDIDKIFEPFFTTRPDGTGLGLAIVRRIIEAHKGQISVESHKDKWTKFRIMLPM